MSRRAAKVRMATTTSSSKSAARSRSRKRRGGGAKRVAKETRSSDTGNQDTYNEDSPSAKPSPTAVQSTLPSATPLHEDERSLQPCATQHGSTELEESIPSIRVRTDFTQDTYSAQTPLVPVTAHAYTDTEDSPDPNRTTEDDNRSSTRRLRRRNNTKSSRAFFPPQLFGRQMSQRRVKRVKSSVDEKRVPPSSDGSGSTKPVVSSSKQSDATNSKRSGSTKKKRNKRDKKGKHSTSSASRDARFFHCVEKNKDRKVEMNCVCPETKCEGCERVFRRFGGCMKTSARACWVVCLPPLPSLVLNKAAFWPPSREYYFFQEKKVGEATKRVKLRRATKSSINQSWTFGFEHPCYKPLSTKLLECFIVETRKKHYIACVMVHTPSMQPRYTLLYSHPNGSDISDHLNGIPSVAEIAKFLDCDILIYDYSGYGISSGSSNEKSLFGDIEGVYQHLLNVRKIDPGKIVLYGYSIGTAAAIALLAETQAPVAGAILLAPLTSMLRVLVWKRLFFNQPFAKQKPCVDKFRSIEKIPLVSVPILICHGKDDIVVPIEHGQAMHDKAPLKVPPLWINDAGHNNLENTKELWMRVRNFLYNELPNAKTPGTSSKTSPILITPLAEKKPTEPTVIHL